LSAAPKGGIEKMAVAVCLKAYPDTNQWLFKQTVKAAVDFVGL
jgi:hypothetical protein